MPPVEALGELVEHVETEAERFADIAHRAAAAIGDHRRGHPRALAAIFSIDVLNHLLAPLVLEIDIDVRRLAAGCGEKSLEQNINLRGVDAGHAEAIADSRVGGRSATLAEDALAA